jgi:DNA-binding CsgD family transcriptional regulator
MRECELLKGGSDEQLVADSRFAEETIQFIARMTGVNAVAFYLVDEGTGRYDFQRLHVSDTFHRQYETGMSRYDPFEFRRIAQSDIRTALLTDSVKQCPEDQHYVRFLRAYGYTDVIETLFRNDGRLIGGISLLLRDEDKQQAVVSAVQAMQPYIEYNLRRTRGRANSARRAEAAQHFMLSAREIDVVELLMLGTTNNDIAESLNISLATVKTHVMKIFHKVGVSNRSTLVYRLSEYDFH